MADLAAELALAEQRFRTGPPASANAITKYRFYLDAAQWIDDFIHTLRNRYLHADNSTLSKEEQQGGGHRVLQGDMHLFEKAVHVHQFVADQKVYWLNFHSTESAPGFDPHAFALERMNDPRRIPLRQFYGLPPPTTGSRMPRYGYNF